MDFDQLHTFLEIVRLKSFSKAAQTCYRTQPAISAQIRQLEHELKAELFSGSAAGFRSPRPAKSSPSMPNACWICAARLRTR